MVEGRKRGGGRWDGSKGWYTGEERKDLGIKGMKDM